MSKKPSFFAELKRRQIYRGGVMYVVAGWVMVQVATQVFPFFDIPVWAIRLVVVAIMMGFPLSLVALWMFESSQPEAEPVDRRKGSREGGAELARLMEAERAERQRENSELIAALAQLKPGTGPGAEPPSGATVAAVAGEVPQAAAASAKPYVYAEPRRKSRTPVLLSLLAILILLSGIWALLAPPAAMQQKVSASGQLAERYVAPGFHQVEEIGVGLLTPLLQKFGIGIAPERVFTLLLVLLAFIVLRNYFHKFMRANSRRRVRRQAQSTSDGTSQA